MAFEFQIPIDKVSDSVFPGARHLNLIDKITSHVIQVDSNIWSPNSKVSDTRASASEVSNLKVSEASDTWVSEVSDMSLGGLESFHLGSKTWSRRPGLEMFSGSDFPGL
jgi:hypothetical protein